MHSEFVISAFDTLWKAIFHVFAIRTAFFPLFVVASYSSDTRFCVAAEELIVLKSFEIY